MLKNFKNFLNFTSWLFQFYQRTKSLQTFSLSFLSLFYALNDVVRLNCLTIASEMFPSSSSPTLLVLWKMLPAQFLCVRFLSFYMGSYARIHKIPPSMLSVTLSTMHSGRTERSENESNRRKNIKWSRIKDEDWVRDACRQPKNDSYRRTRAHAEMQKLLWSDSHNVLEEDG